MNCIARDPKARTGSVLAPPDPRGAAQGRNRRATSVFGGRVARPRVDSRRRMPRLLQHCSGRLPSHFAGLGILSKKVGRNNAEGNEERGFYLLFLRLCSANLLFASSSQILFFQRSVRLWRGAVGRYLGCVVSTAGTRFAPRCHPYCAIVGEGAGPRWLAVALSRAVHVRAD